MKERVNKKTNYRQACIRKDGKYHYMYIRRLVATAFVKGSGKEVNHIDCDKGNNHYDNLEWCSHLENSNHAKENGLFRRGSRHHSTYLGEEEVLEIKRLLKENKLTNKEIGVKFNVTHKLISSIKRGISWKWLKLTEGESNEN